MKFILLMFLLLFPVKEVVGKTYYSDYSSFSDYIEEKIEETDTVNVEVERRYKWYIRSYESGYYLLHENPYGYNYITLGVYREGKFTDWLSEYPGDKYGRLIETQTVCDNEDCSINHLEYRYRERFYYHMKPIEIEKEGYYVYVSEHARRGDEYKDYYRYQTRDKIDVPNRIVITDSSKTVSDYITSTCDYQIEGEIDYQKNGSYKIKIVTDFIEISTDVEIIIEENKDTDYETIISGLRQLLEEKEKIIKNLEDNNKSLQENIKKLENDIVEGEKDYSQLLQQKDELSESKNNLILQLKKMDEEKAEQDKEIENLKAVLEKEKRELNDDVTKCEQNLLGLKNELLIKDKSILFLEQTLRKNNSNIKTVNVTDYEEQYEDVSKKLMLCNQIIDSMQNNEQENKVVRKQSIYYLLFGQAILLLVFTFFWKIKSIKKNN